MAARKRRLRTRIAPESTRDEDWQVEAYAKAMGEEAALRQQLIGRRERGLCVCPGFHGTTLKVRGVFRTIHERDCPRWKPWMEEYESIRKHYGR
jgi:hypothetical protein